MTPPRHYNPTPMFGLREPKPASLADAIASYVAIWDTAPRQSWVLVEARTGAALGDDDYIYYAGSSIGKPRLTYEEMKDRFGGERP